MAKRTRKESGAIKWCLILQSFTPLFVLLLIENWDWSFFKLLQKFGANLWAPPFEVWGKVFHHPNLYSTLLMGFCLISVLLGVLIYLLFRNIQQSSYNDKGEKITVLEDTTGNSVVFFVSYILPLMLDDICELKGFLCFFIILTLVVLLMRNTNLYYQNPILTVLGYRTFRFSFSKTQYDIQPEAEFIAITKGKFDASKVVIRKQIADNVYIVYNKNQVR